MPTKALNINQHDVLHEKYSGDCCLCKSEEKLKALELKLEVMGKALEWADQELVRLKTGKESQLVEIINAQEEKIKAMAVILREVKEHIGSGELGRYSRGWKMYCRLNEILE